MIVAPVASRGVGGAPRAFVPRNAGLSVSAVGLALAMAVRPSGAALSVTTYCTVFVHRRGSLHNLCETPLRLAVRGAPGTAPAGDNVCSRRRPDASADVDPHIRRQRLHLCDLEPSSADIHPHFRGSTPAPVLAGKLGQTSSPPGGGGTPPLGDGGKPPLGGGGITRSKTRGDATARSQGGRRRTETGEKADARSQGGAPRPRSPRTAFHGKRTSS